MASDRPGDRGKCKLKSSQATIAYKFDIYVYLKHPVGVNDAHQRGAQLVATQSERDGALDGRKHDQIEDGLGHKNLPNGSFLCLRKKLSHMHYIHS